MSSTILDPRAFGAVADGKTSDTDAIRRAVEAARPGDTVRLAGGTFLSGTFALQSGLTLEIAPDAVLLGSPDIADYRDCGFRHPEMGETTSLLYALGCEDVTLCGGGRIDFNGPRFMDWRFESFCPREIDPATVSPAVREQMVVSPRKRPTQPVFLDSCRRVAVRDLAFRDAPCWTMTFSRCEDVSLDRVTVDNHRQIPNCDGVHFSASRRCRVSDCTMRCGDDCVAATCITDPSGVCEDVLVERCRFESRSAAVRFGHLDSTVRRVRVRDVRIDRSNRALCVFARDGGSVRDVEVERLEAETSIFAGGWWGKGEPFVLCASDSTGEIDGVALRDCAFVSENPGVVAGRGGNVRNVLFERCSIRLRPGDTHPFYRGKIDLQPNRPLSPAPWEPGDALWIEGADRVRFRDGTTSGSPS